MRYHSRNILLVIATLLFVSGCSTSFTTRLKVADSIAEKSDMQPKIVKGGKFWIRTYQKILDPKLPYVFYIEGDGFAFKNKFTISADPTPRSHTILRLAASDYRSNVVYVARPCQYLEEGAKDHCDNAYWTRKRLAPEIIDAMNDVIKSIAGRQPIDLVGYSSGGGAAVLIASRNNNVRSITSVAGLLDHKLFTEHHRVLDMIGSLNPIDVAYKIRNIPQLHISGGRDTIVRPFIVDSYVKASKSKCVRHEIIPGATHDKGWQDVWKNILDTPVRCER